MQAQFLRQSGQLGSSLPALTVSPRCLTTLVHAAQQLDQFRTGTGLGGYNHGTLNGTEALVSPDFGDELASGAIVSREVKLAARTIEAAYRVVGH